MIPIVLVVADVDFLDDVEEVVLPVVSHVLVAADVIFEVEEDRVDFSVDDKYTISGITSIAK